MSQQVKRVYGERGEKSAMLDLRVVIGYAEFDRIDDAQRAFANEARARLSVLPGGDVVELLLRMRASGLGPLVPGFEYQAQPPEFDGRAIGRT